MAIRPHPVYRTDLEFFEALSRRDDRAYAFLYANLFPSFQHWVLANRGSEMDAEDAFQKGLMSLLLNIESGRHTFQEGTRTTTVAFEYCKRVWYTELKSARFRYTGAMPDQLDVEGTTNIASDLERLDIVNAVKWSLQQLKEDCRRLLEWFYVDEVSLREIAERLGMKEESVKSKRYQCAEKLKGFLPKNR